MPETRTEDWDGLRAIGRGLARVGAVLMMTIVGSIIGGTTGAFATFYCYGIGIYLGIPIGAIAGLVLGLRMPPRDAAITFTLCTGSLLLANAFVHSQRWDTAPNVYSLLAIVIPSGVSCLVGGLSLLLPRLLPRPETRLPVAVAFSLSFGIAAAALFLNHLYGPG